MRQTQKTEEAVLKNTATEAFAVSRADLPLKPCGYASHQLSDWVTGINNILIEEGILLDGSRMEMCEAFEKGGLACIYFPFEGAKLDIGKLAMWRLRSHDVFGGTWLSDYVPNRLGGFIPTATDTQGAIISQ